MVGAGFVAITKGLNGTVEGLTGGSRSDKRCDVGLTRSIFQFTKVRVGVTSVVEGQNLILGYKMSETPDTGSGRKRY